MVSCLKQIDTSEKRSFNKIRTPRAVQILRGANNFQKHANEFNSKSKVRFLKFVHLQVGRFSAFYIKKKKDLTKIQIEKRIYLAIRTDFK